MSIELEQSQAWCHQRMREAARNFYYGMRLLAPDKRHAMHALYAWMRWIDDLADGPEDQRDQDRDLVDVRQSLEDWRELTHRELAARASKFEIPNTKYEMETEGTPLPSFPQGGGVKKKLVREGGEEDGLVQRGGEQSGGEGGGRGGHAGALTDSHPMFPALAEGVHRFGIPPELFDQAMDGQLQDLEQSRYATFDELYGYCYRVASTVGIAAVYIWRFSSPDAIKLAEYRGIAFQLTNILRDLREDAARGRLYLPQEDLSRFGVTCLDKPSEELAELIAFQARRAMEYYRQSAPLESMIEPDSRPTLRVMTAIYKGILDQIITDPLAILHKRVSLSGARKVGEVVRQLYLAEKMAIDGAQ